MKNQINEIDYKRYLSELIKMNKVNPNSHEGSEIEDIILAQGSAAQIDQYLELIENGGK